MPRPLEFYTQNPAKRKPSPGGWCSAQRIQNLYDCRWQSYRYYGVTPFGVTDEVEAKNYHYGMVQNCYLRPHQSQLTLRQLPLQGKPSSLPEVLTSIFTALVTLPGGRGMPRPYRATPGVRPAPHPSRAKARATFPQGKAPLRSTGAVPQGRLFSRSFLHFSASVTWLRGSYVHKICTTCF